MRIGIVGTGIAGLTAGWLFRRAGAHVTIFEEQTRLGMDSHSVSFAIDGKEVRTDVPPRMFNSSLWPNLSLLYRVIGVESEPVEPSKTFGQLGSAALLKLGASYRPKLSPNVLLNSSARLILKDIARMLSEVPDDLASSLTMTMGEYLKTRGYSPAFIYRFIYPALSSTVCTCCFDSLSTYPAEILLKAMLELTRPEGLSRTRHGTQDVVQRLAADINEIRVATTVERVKQTDSGAEVGTTAGQRFEFDHVIVATQANAALRIVETLSASEQEMLAAFRYENVSVVVHRDELLMPNRKKDWSHFNVLSNADDSAAMCTIWMNRFCPDWGIESPVFQTMMPLVAPRPETVIRETMIQRPVVDGNSMRALKLMAEVRKQLNRRIWFCGSYASPGIPLLESGVVSSLDVAERLGVTWPDACSV